MYILPHHYFKIKEYYYSCYKIHKFVPLPHVLAVLADVHKCRVTIHSYIFRTIKQIGRPDLKIFLPRISLIYEENSRKKVKTHVLLTEFCTPYSNYTAKSVCIVKPELIPFKTRAMLSIKTWDSMINLSHSYKYSSQIDYVSSRFKHLHSRFTMIGTEFQILGGLNFKKFSLKTCDSFLRFFYLLLKKGWYINVLEYLEHTISFGVS